MIDRNTLPIFKAIFDPGDATEGVFTVSLVSEPAVESYFLAFDREEALSFSVSNPMERKVIGVVLRANYPILRVDGEGKYYNLIFDRQTIYDLAQEFIKKGFTGSVSVLHDGVPVEDVDLVQIFIKDDSAGVSPKGFEEIEDGSLFAEYKVNNDAVWDMIVKGELKGFSVEGVFGVREDELSGQSVKQANKFNIFNMNKLRDKLAKLLLKFDSVSTDKADLFYDHEGELVVGDEVYIYDAEGERAVPEDGDYESDGYIYVIKEGKVDEIREKEAGSEEKADEALEEVEVPEVPEEKEDTLTPRVEALEAKIADLEAKIADLEAKIAEPVAEPIVEEFNKINMRTGDSRADRLAAIGAALK